MLEKLEMKTYLFIDGTNLYAGQYELFGPKKYLDFSKFIKEVEKKIGTKFDKIHFYASYSPRKKKVTRKEKLYVVNEFQFYKNVKKSNKVEFFKGYRSKASGKEKEVDVKLSVDLVGLGLLDKYSSAYLMTGDADFLQAVFFLKRYKPRIQIKLLCIGNKIMYKGLYALSSVVIDFKDRPLIKDKKILDRNKVIFLRSSDLKKNV